MNWNRIAELHASGERLPSSTPALLAGGALFGLLLALLVWSSIDPTWINSLVNAFFHY